MANEIYRYSAAAATIELTRGNIVDQEVDAIVNAANENLAAGGGVCGAIFQAAGRRELAAACRPLAPCPTGEARITPGFRLPAKQIIHAVGPVYRRRDPGGSAQLLAAVYSNSLALAEQHRLASVAFPSISTGIFGYPVVAAANVAVATVAASLAGAHSVTLVRWVLWDAESLAAYRLAAASLLPAL